MKLRDFQYQLLHNKSFCNDVLVHWHKVESNICNLCHLKKQTIMHLLWECAAVRPIWNYVRAKLHRAGLVCNFSYENILFNTVSSERCHVINLIVLIGKQYFFRCKCLDQKPTKKEFMYEIGTHYKMEIYNSMKEISSNLTRKVRKKWSPVHNLLCS